MDGMERVDMARCVGHHQEDVLENEETNVKQAIFEVLQ